MYISLKDKKIRLKIEKQFRLTERFSAGRKYVSVQIPSWYRKKDFLKITKKLEGWLEKIEKQHPGFLNRYIIKDYDQDSILNVMGDHIGLQLKEANRKTISSIVDGNTLIITTPTPSDPEGIRKAVIEGLKKKYRRKIETEVFTLNEQTVKGQIKSIKLKDNFSNWGSCSNTGNINLSVRLMLLPADVREYVIIHELCHLLELNHSSKFWALVQKHCPEYKVHEKWLDKNGNMYYF